MSTDDLVHDHLIRVHAPDVTEIPHDYDLVAGGVIDSLGLVRLVAWVGDQFGLVMEDMDLDPSDFRTIETTARFIDTHVRPFTPERS